MAKNNYKMELCGKAWLIAKITNKNIKSRRRHQNIFLIPCRATKPTSAASKPYSGSKSEKRTQEANVLICVPHDKMLEHQESIFEVFPKYLQVERVPVFEVAREISITEEGRITLPYGLLNHLSTESDEPAQNSKRIKAVDVVGWGAVFAIEKHDRKH